MQVLFSYLPVSQRLFGLESITLHDWLLILITSLPVMFIVELEKAVQRRFNVITSKNNQLARQ